MELRTLCDLYFEGAKKGLGDERFLRKGPEGWKPIGIAEIQEQVRLFAGALLSVGVAPGDRVAILSYNRPVWAMVDYAALTIGAASVPIYSTLPSDQVQYILRDAEPKVVFVENAEQFEKTKSLASQTHIVNLESGGGELWNAFLERGRGLTAEEHRKRADQVTPDDLATVIYTSGTTGNPKGVMLTHRNLASNVQGTCSILPFTETDLALSFLPLSHVFERMCDYTLFYLGATIAYAEHIDKVADNLIEVRPTFMAAVPRFYEKVYAKMQAAVAALPPKRKKMFDWAYGVGGLEAAFRMRGQTPPLGLRWRYWWAQKLVLRKFHARVGGRMRVLISGGAPLSKEIAQFFWALGFSVYEGYGLTETSPVLTVNYPGNAKLGSVGRKLPGVDLEIASDGEILARGPNIMKGYYKLPKESAEVLQNGWFHTGDIGEFDAEGFLKITDRKKDLMKTSGGKYIAPQPIENKLKMHPAVASAIVVADKRKFPSVLIVPDFSVLKSFVGVDGPPEVLVQDPKVRAFFRKILEQTNEGLAHFEQLKKFELLPAEFTIGSGELTPTMKVKRRIVEKRYSELIDTLYQE